MSYISESQPQVPLKYISKYLRFKQYKWLKNA